MKDKSNFDTWKDECEAKIFEIHGFTKDDFTYDIDGLTMSYKDGMSPIDVALDLKITDYD